MVCGKRDRREQGKFGPISSGAAPLSKEDIVNLHRKLHPVLRRRLKEFREVGRSGGDKVLLELLFCLLTPQSKAKNCWNAVESMKEKGLLGGKNHSLYFLRKERIRKIEEILLVSGVRFHKTKAERVAAALERFGGCSGASREKKGAEGKGGIIEILEPLSGPEEKREWLVREVNGYGLKEASHFLRNVGWGEDLAILDRHILKNLASLGVIPEIPSHLNREKYFGIEKKMRDFSLEVEIPMAEMDLLLWYVQTGEVFK